MELLLSVRNANADEENTVDQEPSASGRCVCLIKAKNPGSITLFSNSN